jgi:hypothetical protein
VAHPSCKTDDLLVGSAWKLSLACKLGSFCKSELRPQKSSSSKWLPVEIRFLFSKHQFPILHFPNSTGLFTKPTGRHYTKHHFSPDIGATFISFHFGCGWGQPQRQECLMTSANEDKTSKFCTTSTSPGRQLFSWR